MSVNSDENGNIMGEEWEGDEEEWEEEEEESEVESEEDIDQLPQDIELDKPISLIFLGDRLDNRAEAWREEFREDFKPYKVVMKIRREIIGPIMEFNHREANRIALNSEEIKAKRDRDEAVKELQYMEQAFSEVHSKYEQAKLVVDNLRTNIETLTAREKEQKRKLCSCDHKEIGFKKAFGHKVMEIENDFLGKIDELEEKNRKLEANYRRNEVKIEALESEVAQKVKENNQLNNLLDEFIGKTRKTDG